MRIDAKVDLNRAVKQLRRFGKAFHERKVLNGIGLRHLAWLHQNVVQEGAEKKWQGLRASTKWSKQQQGYGTKAGVMTGKMKQSFTSKVLGNAVEVGTNKKTAIWFHGGTKAHKIIPKNKQFLRFFHPLAAGGYAFSKGVQHPGTPARPLLPTQVLGTKLAVKVVDAMAKAAARKANL